MPLVSKYIMPGDDEPNFQDEDANNSTCKALFEKVKNRGPNEQHKHLKEDSVNKKYQKESRELA